MHRVKNFIDIGKEEVWLKNMSAQGWSFSRRSLFGYYFQQSRHGEQTYRIDYRTFGKRADFVDYISLFQDAGWDHVFGTKSSGYQYFVARDDNSDADIFSDDAARSSRYKRLAIYWLQILTVYLAFVLALFFSGVFNLGVFLDPQSLYYTPSLWERQGTMFWAAFFLETPIVVLRNLWVLMPVMLGVSIYCFIRTLILSKRSFA